MLVCSGRRRRVGEVGVAAPELTPEHQATEEAAATHKAAEEAESARKAAEEAEATVSRCIASPVAHFPTCSRH